MHNLWCNKTYEKWMAATGVSWGFNQPVKQVVKPGFSLPNKNNALLTPVGRVLASNDPNLSRV